MKRIPEEMENLILEMLQEGETYKAIVARTGVSESTVGRVARDNGICRIKGILRTKKIIIRKN